jgi:hypothetical protein
VGKSRQDYKIKLLATRAANDIEIQITVDLIVLVIDLLCTGRFMVNNRVL